VIDYRPASARDADAIARLHARSWRENYRGEFHDSFLDGDLDGERLRVWRERLVDHDGASDGDGGIARWLHLTDILGLDREYVTSLRGLLPATRFSVDAYVHFVRDKTLLEAVASSLTELFSPAIIGERVRGMLEGYAFITPEALAYFDKRPPQADRDAQFALDYVKRHATTEETQQQVIAALAFKCDVLWTMLDALMHAYVMPGHVPPGAFVPDEG